MYLTYRGLEQAFTCVNRWGYKDKYRTNDGREV